MICLVHFTRKWPFEHLHWIGGQQNVESISSNVPKRRRNSQTISQRFSLPLAVLLHRLFAAVVVVVVFPKDVCFSALLLQVVAMVAVLAPWPPFCFLADASCLMYF